MENNYKIVYEQAYTPRLDITIIMKYVFKNGNIISQKVSGFYYGEPRLNAMETFKEKNYIGENE